MKSQLSEARALLREMPWPPLDPERPMEDFADWRVWQEKVKVLLSRPAEEAPDMVPVTRAMLRAAEEIPAIKTINAWCSEMQMVRGRKANWSSEDPPLAQAYRAMFAAAQNAERERK